ncbi:MAG: phosphate acetyltransferase [Flavobacteriia bacterium]|nr:MAG: phosphate acetyltransferase [Flavobacteriia bacterium]
MSKAVYIATMESQSGKSIVTLGLMRMLLGKVANVGYFKPIISDLSDNKKDNHIDLITTHFNLDIKFTDAYSYTKSEVLQKKHEGKIDEVIDTIIEKFKRLEEKYDFILVEGTDFTGEGVATELDINTEIAKNLGIPTIIVESGVGKSMVDFTNNLLSTADLFKENDVEVLAVIANKLQPENLEWVKEELRNRMPANVLVYAIPLVEQLTYPIIGEILEDLDAKVIIGDENCMNNQVAHTIVGAMQLRNFLTHIKEKTLIIIPGDRADLIMGSLQAHQSKNYPSVSGIILSGGLEPEPTVLKLLDSYSNCTTPIISVKSSTFETASILNKMKPKIKVGNTSKVEASISTFEKYTDVEALSNSLITFKTKGITPRMFQYNLLQKAKASKKHIVLPEGYDERVLGATAKLISQDVATITLLGEKEAIQKKLYEYGIELDLNKVNVVNPIESEHFDDYAETYYELRKHKGINMAIAKDKMADVSFFGTMMVYKGHADGMVSGAVHTTQHTIIPALQFVKTKPGVSIVSSIFFMMLDDRVSVMGDCAINPNPTSEQLAEIAITSADSTKAFGIEPKVAMLSYSSGTSGIGEDVDRVRKATEIVKELRPDIKVEGPIQYDAAVDPGVGKKKLPNSEVAGQASVLIFPDLNTGNNTYKAVQRETGALAVGPMLQGLNKPVNDLSRGCTTEDIYNTVIITAIQAGGL